MYSGFLIRKDRGSKEKLGVYLVNTTTIGRIDSAQAFILSKRLITWISLSAKVIGNIILVLVVDLIAIILISVSYEWKATRTLDLSQLVNLEINPRIRINQKLDH